MASRGLQDSGGLGEYVCALQRSSNADGLADISPDTVKVKEPFLYIGGSKDYVCLPELHADENLRKACEDLRVGCSTRGTGFSSSCRTR